MQLGVPNKECVSIAAEAEERETEEEEEEALGEGEKVKNRCGRRKLRVMHSLTSCCTHNGASQGFTPYQRLPRSRSSSRSHSSIDAQSDHFVVLDALTSPSCSDSNHIDSHNSVDSQLKRSSHNVAPPAHSNHDSSSHCDISSQSKCFDCHDTAPAVVVPSSSSPSQINPIPHHIDTCTVINTFTSTAQIECEKSPVDFNDDVNTVLVKIGIVGDSETGKTSFMAKYGGVEIKNDVKEVVWLQKLCKLRHVNIGLRIWDLGGKSQSDNKLNMVCRDAAAIFIMFDLTRRSTLLSVKKWFLRARKCNKVL
eukprot:c18444_g1_i3 orf=61-987(+)